jgi:hypothetical protein
VLTSQSNVFVSLRSMLRVGSRLSAAGSKAFFAGALSLMSAAQLGVRHLASSGSFFFSQAKLSSSLSLQNLARLGCHCNILGMVVLGSSLSLRQHS